MYYLSTFNHVNTISGNYYLFAINGFFSLSGWKVEIEWLTYHGTRKEIQVVALFTQIA